MSHPDLISTAEATAILGYANPSSVARLVYEGKLPYVRQMGGGRHGAYIFDRAVVEALAAERAKVAS